MSFHFSLESLLRYRRGTEQREELKLQAIGQQLAAARKQLDALEQMQRDMRCGLADYMESGARGAEIHFAQNCEQTLGQARSSMKGTVASLEKEYEEQIAVVTSERQQRETLEKLREQEHQLYCRERNRREQSQADEMFLMRLRLHRD